MGVSPRVQQAEIFGMGTQVAIVIFTLRGHKILRDAQITRMLLFVARGNCFGLNNNKDSRLTFLEPFPEIVQNWKTEEGVWNGPINQTQFHNL